MNHPRRFSWILTIALLSAVLAGCGSSPAARFYLLTPTAQAPAAPDATAKSPNVTLAVGPVDLPAYLDRPQMARRVDDNRLDFSEFDRWAEPLKKNVSQVLVENLRAMLPDLHVVSFPVASSMPRPEYQAAVDFLRFESAPEKTAVLEARYSIRNGATGELLAHQTVRFSQAFGGRQWGAAVAAQSKCLELLSRDIATALQETQKTAKPQ